MKIIGITGYSNAGKTTVSRILFKDCYRRIIHLDKIHTNIKKKYLSKNINTIKMPTGEELVYLNSEKFITKVINNKYLRPMYLKLRFMYDYCYTHNMINYFIENFKDLDYLIIDGCSLIELGLENYCDELIYVNVDYSIRCERLKKRDRFDKISNGDKKMIYRNFKNIKLDVDLDKYHIITNNGTKKELLDEIKMLEEKILENNHSKRLVK